MANYGDNGYINFSRLWELMERKNVNKQWLRDNGIHIKYGYKAHQERKCYL